MNAIEVDIVADSVTLRELAPADIDPMVTGCNDPLVQRFLLVSPHPYTEADAREFVHETAPRQWTEGGAVFAIADPRTDRLVGCVGIHPRRGRTVGEIGYWVAPEVRGRGVATDAARAAATWAFNHGYARLELRTDVANGASQRVALAAGFVREGEQRGGGRPAPSVPAPNRRRYPPTW